ncbi:MAG: hypothetical protein H0V66_10580 [Bdellovibrionales bacterium]|nr:hypothetical protein [Bdellovibrionales bacterium]
MNTTRSMVELYKLFERLKGPVEARELIVAIVFNNIADIQDEGLVMTAEELDKRMNAHINDYLEVAKKTNVA